MKNRASLPLSLVLWMFAWPVLAREGIVVRLDIKVPMRDRIELSANVFLPNEEGRFPTILLRTPYGNGDANNEAARAFASAGYAYVIQDTRGRFESQAVFNPFMDEAQDGYDTQEWVREQPWSNGRIGTDGTSYVGFTQWISAPLGAPAVKAMFPLITFTDFHDDVTYVGGAFQLALSLVWAGMVTMQPGEDITKVNLQQLFLCLPLTEYTRILGRKISFYDDWLAHPDYDGYWRRASVGDRFNKITVPVYSMGNWYDIFSRSTVESFRRRRESAPTEELKSSHKLLMGIGAHGLPSRKLGERDFGESAALDVQAIDVGGSTAG